MDPIDVEIPPERRGRLIVKGQILYGKFRGTGGRRVCAESFALHPIRQGEPTVARDLVERIQHLRMADSHRIEEKWR